MSVSAITSTALGAVIVALAIGVAENIWADEIDAWPAALQWLVGLGGPALGAVAGYWVGYEAPQRPATTHGSAQFGDDRRTRSALGGPGGLIIGRASGGWLMRYDGPGHLLTFAPTRSGKGVGVVLPNLLLSDSAILCVDPKGENARIAARARARFGPVHVLDPFEASGQPTASYNPLAALDPFGLDLAEDAALIAEALVYDPPEQVSEAHWNEEAKALIAGVILHVVTHPPPEGATLAAVRDLLTAAPARFAATLKAMQASPAADGLVARAANRHLGKADREATGVLSAAQRHTHFLDSRRITDSLARADFAFEDLRDQRATVFLVLPPERLGTHARWLRLLVAQALHSLARGPTRGGAKPSPVLFLLDEFATLGQLEPLAQAYGLMAGYGVQLWAILQDLHQLKALYGERHGTFLANAAVTQVFNVADIDTAQWVSRTLGVTTETFIAHGSSMNSGTTTSLKGGSSSSGDGESWSEQRVRRDLLTPDEVIRLPDHMMLVLRPGRDPLIAGKIRHYADSEFSGLHDP
ncbi:MAG: type IV secretory system conjugative DNA transfer family protein [Phenylobacterium sp.]|nr:type IV secretory system conjugative DNA transfer family protein [Phenylobacterium sp.]